MKKLVIFQLFFVIMIFSYFNTCEADEIHDAAQSCDLTEVKKILSKCPDLVNTKDQNGCTPLHLATKKDCKDIVHFLLSSGASVDAKLNDNYTSLHIASKEGYLEIVELLVANGADINAKGLDGYTPLHCAARNGYVEIVDFFLKKRCECKRKN